MEKRTTIELHCHTKMSSGMGLIEPGELVRYACDNGYKAIAITDCGSVQAFPEVYQTWKELWEEYANKCKEKGEEASEGDFLKVIYGLEGYLTDMKSVKRPLNRYPVLLYAKNETGIRNLYKIVTESNFGAHDAPTIPKEILDKYRDGILVGAVCDGGEAMAFIHSSDYWSDAEYIQDLKNILSYYDFIEISPFNQDKGPDIRYMYHVYKNGGMIVAASDAYYLNEKDKKYWDVLTKGKSEEYTDRPRHLMKWNEIKNPFRCWHEPMPEILKVFPDMVIANQFLIVDEIEYVSPLIEE